MDAAVQRAYSSNTAAFMRRTNMNILNIMAKSDDVDDDTMLRAAAPFLAEDGIDAILYYTYGTWYSGTRGKALWSNGKPIIGARFSLWDNGTDEESPHQGVDALVQTLLAQPRNPTNSEGYSVIPVHAWSHTVADVKNVVDQLFAAAGGGVRVLTAQDFIRQYIEQVSP